MKLNKTQRAILHEAIMKARMDRIGFGPEKTMTREEAEQRARRYSESWILPMLQLLADLADGTASWSDKQWAREIRDRV